MCGGSTRPASPLQLEVAWHLAGVAHGELARSAILTVGADRSCALLSCAREEMRAALVRAREAFR